MDGSSGIGGATKSVLGGEEFGYLNAFGKKGIDEVGMLGIGEDTGVIDREGYSLTSCIGKYLLNLIGTHLYLG